MHEYITYLNIISQLGKHTRFVELGKRVEK